MEKLIENVHVEIYSKKMLKEAILRLEKLGQKVEDNILRDYERGSNDILTFVNGEFRIVETLVNLPNIEITLNDLCEMITDQQFLEPKLKIGDWVITSPKSKEFLGFTVFKVSSECSAKIHNDPSSAQSSHLISEEDAKSLFKMALECGRLS